MAPVLSEATNHRATLRRDAPSGPAVCDRGGADGTAEAVPAPRSGGAALLRQWADVSADGALGASPGGSDGASHGCLDSDGGRSVARVSSLA